MMSSLFKITRLCKGMTYFYAMLIGLLFHCEILGHVFRNLSTANISPTTQNAIYPVLSQAAAVQNPWIWQKNNAFQLPVVKKTSFELPNGLIWIPPITEPLVEKTIEAPSTPETDIAKYAVRMIVIRRKK